LQGQQPLNTLIDFDLHFVDGVFLSENRFREMLLGIEHGVDGLVDGALNEAAHPEEALLQLFEIVFEMAFHSSSIPRKTGEQPPIIQNGR
jgi:hypothetical protein